MLEKPRRARCPRVDRCGPAALRRCNEIMHQQKSDQAAAAALSACPLLSASWKDALWARARRPAPDEGARDARLGME